MTREHIVSNDVEENVLGEVCRTVVRLMSAAAPPPHRISIRAGEIAVEVEWPDAAAQTITAEPAMVEEKEEDAHYIRAGMVGTFYRASEPGAKPFVSEGDIVEPGRQVGILEAMKLMTPVEADRPARVTEIHVSDGEPVEFGTRLMSVVPLDVS